MKRPIRYKGSNHHGKALAVVNQLEQEGVIGRYAVGGAVAATRCIEPIQTYDLDIFVLLPALTSGLLTITPIYSRLMQMGYELKAEFLTQPQQEFLRLNIWPQLWSTRDGLKITHGLCSSLSLMWLIE